MIPLPPKLDSLLAGTKLVAGLSHSTILPDIDFETYSPAGFIWNIVTGKFDKPRGANKKGLPAIGMAVYSEHPDTEVLSCAYDLKDGLGKRLWKPGDSELPIDLWNHVQRGGLLEAWNAGFEYWIWVNVCVRKYHWPRLLPHQLRCAAAKARAHGLPGHLESAGTVLNTSKQKDKQGKRLLNKFSMPRNPTKGNTATRIHPKDDPADAALLYAYNLRDIEAEAEISSLVPDLTGGELEFWMVDQTINRRGVAVDSAAIRSCLAIVEQAHARYTAELQTLTNGEVRSISEIAKFRKWLQRHDVHTFNLTSETVTELLRLPEIPSVCKRALEIRELIGSAAVKKLYAMINTTSRKGRIHDLFIYHSARTGRAAGAGAQPQNLPNSGMEVSHCTNPVCLRHFHRNMHVCPWCGTDSTHNLVEWNPQAVGDALETIAPGSIECVNYFFRDAIATISGCLRGMFVAASGHDLICSDFSAIEGVVLAALAGEEWRMEVFKTHGMIYEMSASKICKIPIEEFRLHKGTTGHHHPKRKLGKVAELACFTHDTLVLTERGYVAIMDVQLTDKLWDGRKWVNHAGVIYKGKREVIKVDGVRMTPGHPINLGDSWKAAKELALNENILIQALASASDNLPTLESSEDQKKVIGWQNVNAHAVNLLIRLILILEPDGQDDAIDALRKLHKPKILNGSRPTKATDILYRILDIDEDWGIVFHRLLAAVTILKTLPMQITENAVLRFVTLGAEKSMNFLRILLGFRAGMMQCLKWIEWIVMEITNLETSDSLLDQIINLTNEKSMTSKKEFDNLNNVYDIVNAGPLHRFTIKTSSGHLIVHNSGYQGWIGAWKQFGADQFFSDDEIKTAILAWRDASPAIVEMWGGQQRRWNVEFYGLEGAAVQAVSSPGTKFSYRAISYLMLRDVLYCELPSGRHITYHKPRLSPSDRRPDTLSLSYEGWNTNPKNGPTGWIRMNTYGGKLTENVVQAVARDILAHAIVNLEKSGYPVVLHVHDEIVAEVPESHGSVEEFERIMADLPTWAADWPIRASGGWRSKRYAK